MNEELGIVRNEASLNQGISDINYYLSVSDKIRYDSSVRFYDIYSLQGILTLGKAVLISAKERKESRGVPALACETFIKELKGDITIASMA